MSKSIDKRRAQPRSTMGLVGLTTTNKYQLDAYMHPGLQEAIDQILDTYRSWSELKVVHKISFGWATGIQARNRLLNLGAQRIIQGTTWLDEILNQFPF